MIAASFGYASVAQAHTCIIGLSNLAALVKVPNTWNNKSLMNDLLSVARVPLKIVLDDSPQISPNTIRGYVNDVIPSLVTLELPKFIPKIDHELQTARDYARFLAANHNLNFLYLSHFNKMTVPFFDGLVLDPKTGVSLLNVSIKHVPAKDDPAPINELVEHIKRFLNYNHQLPMIKDPLQWFYATTNFPANNSIYRSESYSEKIVQSALLMNVFGLFTTNGKPVRSREIRTVFDVRRSGQTIEDFLNPRVQQALKDKLHSLPNNMTLTLLWDPRTAIEFTKDSTQVYK